MRLWRQDLIPYLDDRRLLGQHREVAALRGGGWGRRHSAVDYVFKYGPSRLYAYHCLVMDEMERRGFRPDGKWRERLYRGRREKPFAASEAGSYVRGPGGEPVYPEHDGAYMLECLDNLAAKGAELVGGETISSMRAKIVAEAETEAPRADLAVVCQPLLVDRRGWTDVKWHVVEISDLPVPRDPAAPRYVTRSALLANMTPGAAGFSSRQEALLRYAASGGVRETWSAVSFDLLLRRYRLVKEDF